MTVNGELGEAPERGESPLRRSDRNWGDILQEVRVAQAGTQILTGFLLTIAFQPRFAELDTYQRTLYLCLIVVAVVTTALSLLPVTMHRALFRRRVKEATVRFGGIVLRFVLGGVLLTLAGTLALVLDVVAGRTVGVISGIVILLVLIGSFLAITVFARSVLRRGPAS